MNDFQARRPTVLALRPDLVAVLPGTRITIDWETRDADLIRITGPDGFGVEHDASAGRGTAQLHIHQTGALSASAFAGRAWSPVLSLQVAVYDPLPALEFPPLDVGRVFVPGYQRVRIPLPLRDGGAAALLGAARFDAGRIDPRPVVRRGRPRGGLSDLLVPPLRLFAPGPVRDRGTPRAADAGPALRHGGRTGRSPLTALITTFTGRRRRDRSRGSDHS